MPACLRAQVEVPEKEGWINANKFSTANRSNTSVLLFRPMYPDEANNKRAIYYILSGGRGIYRLVEEKIGN